MRRLNGEPAWIVPLFMSDGRYTRHRIPELFGIDKTADRNGLSVLPPLGLHSGIADLATDRALDWAEGEGLVPASVTLVLIGHGSEDDPASRDAAELQAARVRNKPVFGNVATAFLQQSPHVADVIGGIDGPMIAVGLFAANGVHGAEDVPRLMSGNSARQSIYLGAIGVDPKIPDIIVDLVGVEA